MLHVNGSGKAVWLLALCIGLVGAAQAQGMRDPTQAPREAQAVTGATTDPTDPSGPAAREGNGMAVVVRDGVPYLVDGTRLHGVGQKLGSARIERITETEVWLRSGKTLRKLQRFSGIERKPAAKDKGSLP
jgi:hypothetical protein